MPGQMPQVKVGAYLPAVMYSVIHFKKTFRVYDLFPGIMITNTIVGL